MRYSGIGGQAVMEGVMMRNGSDYAVAVRTSEGKIEITKKHLKMNRAVVNKIPILRGMVAFIDSLVLGLSSLTVSASYFEDEEEDEKTKNLSPEKKAAKEKAEIGGTLALSFVLALAIFVALPYGLSQLLERLIPSQTLIILLEGILRVAIFIGYILAISKMEDIKRTFMYHGAEHKCINCIEHGMDLTVENVRQSSRQHKRCGTSFLLYVFLISVILFMFIRMDSRILQLLCRILLMPVIAGISYEFIRLAGRSDNGLVNVIAKPGLWMQGLTTAEPDDSMIEVGIASVEAVFDWKAYLRELRGEPEETAAEDADPDDVKADAEEEA